MRVKDAVSEARRGKKPMRTTRQTRFEAQLHTPPPQRRLDWTRVRAARHWLPAAISVSRMPTSPTSTDRRGMTPPPGTTK